MSHRVIVQVYWFIIKPLALNLMVIVSWILVSSFCLFDQDTPPTRLLLSFTLHLHKIVHPSVCSYFRPTCHNVYQSTVSKTFDIFHISGSKSLIITKEIPSHLFLVTTVYLNAGTIGLFLHYFSCKEKKSSLENHSNFCPLQLSQDTIISIGWHRSEKNQVE